MFTTSCFQSVYGCSSVFLSDSTYLPVGLHRYGKGNVATGAHAVAVSEGRPVTRSRCMMQLGLELKKRLSQQVEGIGASESE
jgi:hypothetical protein